MFQAWFLSQATCDEDLAERVFVDHIIFFLGWSSLMVLPQYQFKGIGSALLRHGFDDLGADQVPICLVTQLRGREIYLKFAFEDVDVIDIDMSDFAGPYRGFGIHRNVFMVRQPGGVPGKGPKAEIKW